MRKGAKSSNYVIGNKDRGVSFPFLTSESYGWVKLVMLLSANNVTEDCSLIYGLFLFKSK